MKPYNFVKVNEHNLCHLEIECVLGQLKLIDYIIKGTHHAITKQAFCLVFEKCTVKGHMQ